jgi:hypothetical protein
MLSLTFALAPFSMEPGYTSETKELKPVERISPEQTRSKILAEEAILVCSYNDNRCKNILLKGALLKSMFKQKLPSLPKNKEIIFYCS